MTTSKKEAARWGYIFETFGEDDLRTMLFKAAMNHQDDDRERTVIEFRDDKALDITEHVSQLEDNE